jgi:hypothetical protein
MPSAGEIIPGCVSRSITRVDRLYVDGLSLPIIPSAFSSRGQALWKSPGLTPGR